MSQVDWQAWYGATLDALLQVIEDSSVSWATDADGNPWVIAGDRTRTGLEFPACLVPTFGKSRDGAESTARNELHTISATLLILQDGDPQTPEVNLRESLDLAAQVENALYDNRSLKVDVDGGGVAERTCERVTVTDSTPFAAPNDSGGLYGAEVQASILKEADHY